MILYQPIADLMYVQIIGPSSSQRGKKTKVKTIGTSMSGLPVAQLFFLIIILRQN
jgi:hypothetical protein